MQTTKSFLVGLLVLFCSYRGDGLLDTENTLLTAIKQLNSTFQQTAAELQYAKNAISEMNATIQKSAAELQNAKNTIATLNATIQQSGKEVSKPIIFYAFLSKTRQFRPGQMIDFDMVPTNVGNAYDPRHGYFTAPVDGYYHFSVTITSTTNDYFQAEIVKNGNVIARLFAGQPEYQTGAGTVITELAANDVVWLKHYDSTSNSLDGPYCYFSGFLISKKP